MTKLFMWLYLFGLAVLAIVWIPVLAIVWFAVWMQKQPDLL